MIVKPDPNLPWPLDYEDGVLPIAGYEGCVLKAYQCQAGKWSCGWGETDDVGPSTVWTQEYADRRFCESLRHRVDAVRAACTLPPNSNQLAALTSLSYNYGGWKNSTVLRAHNKGDFAAAARAFGLINKFTNPATGKLEVSDGLTARRADEAARYLRPAGGQHLMPQEVAGESNVAKGPIGASGLAVGGTGMLSLLGEAKEKLGVVGDALGGARSFLADTLGVPTGFVVPAIVVACGAAIVWWRIKQRTGGWA